MPAAPATAPGGAQIAAMQQEIRRLSVALAMASAVSNSMDNNKKEANFYCFRHGYNTAHA